MEHLLYEILARNAVQLPERTYAHESRPASVNYLVVTYLCQG